jgi:hypothetical protein
MVEGFVLYNAEGKWLMRRLAWTNSETKCVFTQQEVDIILASSKNWQIKPAYKRQAQYNPNKDAVTVTGDRLKV